MNDWDVYRRYANAVRLSVDRHYKNPRVSWKQKHTPVVICDITNRWLSGETPPHTNEYETAKTIKDETMAKFSSDYKFVRCNLGKAEKAAFTKWYTDNEKGLLTALQNLLTQGYKVSFSADFENNCFVCTLTGNEERSPNHKKMLSSRSEDHWEALGLCIFKHVILFKGDAWESEESNWG